MRAGTFAFAARGADCRAMKQKTPKGPKPKANCLTCNGKGAIVCRRCWGARTYKDWMHKVHECGGCGGTGEQACIICKQMGYRQ